MWSRLAIGLFIVSGHAAGQTDSLYSSPTEKQAASYYNLFSFSALVEDSETDVRMSMIHGIEAGRFRIGIGLGYDAYNEWDVIPFSTSVGVDFARVRGNSFFLDLIAGSARTKWKMGNEWIAVSNGTGVLLSPSIGYRIADSKIDAVVMLGYNYQQAKASYHYTWDEGDPPSTVFSRMERLNRLNVTIGFGFH